MNRIAKAQQRKARRRKGDTLQRNAKEQHGLAGFRDGKARPRPELHHELADF